MANFPTTLPSFTVTSGSETLNGAAGGLGLSGLLNSFEGEITAIGTKLGTGATTPVANTLFFGTGVGTSAWQTLTSAQLLATISDETGTGALVFANSPTIVTPTIASFTNAQHDHSNAAGGGQITGSTGLVNSTVTASKLATGATVASVATSETTTSTTYADLTTTTDSVTVTVGANGLALISIMSAVADSITLALVFVSVAVSGASTVAASDANGFEFQNVTANGTNQLGVTYILTGLTPGSTTFKMKYRVQTGGSGAGTGTFSNRRISVVPL